MTDGDLYWSKSYISNKTGLRKALNIKQEVLRLNLTSNRALRRGTMWQRKHFRKINLTGYGIAWRRKRLEVRKPCKNLVLLTKGR